MGRPFVWIVVMAFAALVAWGGADPFAGAKWIGGNAVTCPDYDFGAWICTIAKNTFVDFDRSRRSNALNPNNNLPLDGKCGAAQATIPTPEESIINAQQRAQIDRYISMLPENYRRMFVMRFLDEYSYEEIAEALEMKLGTVKTQIFRVRALMCKMITDGEKADLK